MVDNLSVVRSHIVAHMLYRISPGKPRERVVLIVLIPVVRSEKIGYPLLLPCGVELVMRSGVKRPSFRQCHAGRDDGTGLRMTREIVAEDVHGCLRCLARCRVGGDDGVPVKLSVSGAIGRYRRGLALIPASPSISYGEVQGVVHSQTPP